MAYLRYFVIPIIASFLMIGCSRKHDSRLLEADSILNSEPLKALSLLEETDSTSLYSISDRMLRKLLIMEAEDKTDKDIRSDSLRVKELLEYYVRGNREEELHARVFYRGGRVFYERGNLPKALEFFRKALRNAEEKPDPLFMMALHSQIAGIFTDCKLYQHALKHVKEQLHYSQLSKITPNIINANLMLAAIYRSMDSTGNAGKIYDSLLPIVKESGLPEMQTLYATQLASFFMDNGDYERADSMMKSTDIVTDYASNSSVKSVINRLNLHYGREEDMEAISRELIERSDNGYARAKSARNLARLSLKRNNLREGLDYADRYYALTESIANAKATSTVAELNRLYSQSEFENEHLQMKVENLELREERWRYGSLALALVVVLIFFLAYMQWKKIKMKNSFIEKQRKQTFEINSKNQTINQLQDDLRILNERLKVDSLRKKETEEEIKNLTDRIEKLITERDNLMNALCLIPTYENEKSFAKELYKSRKTKPKEELLFELKQYIHKNYPQFYDKIINLNLPEILLYDAMLIKLNMQQKEIAEILQISPSNLGTIRSRQFQKSGLEKKNFSGWSKFIRSLDS